MYDDWQDNLALDNQSLEQAGLLSEIGEETEFAQALGAEQEVLADTQSSEWPEPPTDTEAEPSADGIIADNADTADNVDAAANADIGQTAEIDDAAAAKQNMELDRQGLSDLLRQAAKAADDAKRVNAAGQLLRPILQEMTEKRLDNELEQAFNQHQQAWPELASMAERKLLLRQMVEIAHEFGDPSLWRKSPSRMMQLASQARYGAPPAIKQAALDAALAAGRAEGLTAASANKLGLDASSGHGRGAALQLSAEEQIAADIAQVVKNDWQ